MIGSFMALWIIVYGAVQAVAPKLLAKAPVQSASGLAIVLAMVPFILAVFVWQGGVFLTPVLVAGLFVFGALFALNSALHSFLILHFTTAERVTMDVGFYYMANASGRLVGTVLSGLSYQLGGLPLCLLVASLMLAASGIVARRLPAVAL